MTSFIFLKRIEQLPGLKKATCCFLMMPLICVSVCDNAQQLLLNWKACDHHCFTGIKTCHITLQPNLKPSKQNQTSAVSPTQLVCRAIRGRGWGGGERVLAPQSLDEWKQVYFWKTQNQCLRQWVLTVVMGPPRLMRHPWRCPCFSVIPP